MNDLPPRDPTPQAFDPIFRRSILAGRGASRAPAAAAPPRPLARPLGNRRRRRDLVGAPQAGATPERRQDRVLGAGRFVQNTYRQRDDSTAAI